MGRQFQTPVFDFPGVDVFHAAFVRLVNHLYAVVACHIKQIQFHVDFLFQQGLRHGQFIMKDAFRLQVGIFGNEHKKFPNGGIAKTFAKQGFQLGSRIQFKVYACLGYPFHAE